MGRLVRAAEWVQRLHMILQIYCRIFWTILCTYQCIQICLSAGAVPCVWLLVWYCWNIFWQFAKWQVLLLESCVRNNNFVRKADTVLYSSSWNCNFPYSLLFKDKILSVLFLKWVPRHEGVWREWRYSSTHSLSRH